MKSSRQIKATVDEEGFVVEVDVVGVAADVEALDVEGVVETVVEDLGVGAELHLAKVKGAEVAVGQEEAPREEE